MKNKRFTFLLRFFMVLFFSIGMLCFFTIPSGYPQQRFQKGKTTTNAQTATQQPPPRQVQTQQPVPRQAKPTGHGSISITSSDFGTLTKTFFSNAILSANSSGNVNDYPHQMLFSKPGVAKQTSPLGRVEYNLTEDEKKRTTGNFWSGIPLIAMQSGRLRTKTIRASVQYWTPELWLGSVTNGQMRIQIKFHTIQRGVTVPNSMPLTTPLVKTRRIVEHSYTKSDAPVVGDVLPLFKWMNTWNWQHPYADATIFDYHNGQSWLNVVLSPGFVNGSITYSVVSAEWEMTGGRFMHSHTIAASFKNVDFGLFEQLPNLQGRILAYNESCKESILSFVRSVLNQADVKALLSQGLLNLARQKLPIGSTITKLRGDGGNILVYY